MRPFLLLHSYNSIKLWIEGLGIIIRTQSGDFATKKLERSWHLYMLFPLAHQLKLMNKFQVSLFNKLLVSTNKPCSFDSRFLLKSWAKKSHKINSILGRRTEKSRINGKHHIHSHDSSNATLITVIQSFSGVIQLTKKDYELLMG